MPELTALKFANPLAKVVQKFCLPLHAVLDIGNAKIKISC